MAQDLKPKESGKKKKHISVNSSMIRFTVSTSLCAIRGICMAVHLGAPTVVLEASGCSHPSRIKKLSMGLSPDFADKESRIIGFFLNQATWGHRAVKGRYHQAMSAAAIAVPPPLSRNGLKSIGNDCNPGKVCFSCEITHLPA